MVLNYSIVIYTTFINIKLIYNILNINLIKLNNITSNYLFMLIVLLCINMFLFKNIIIYFILLTFNNIIKKKKIFFIKSFLIGTFKIHPLMFYISIIFCIYIFIKNYVQIKINFYFILKLSILTLILGSL
jgi:hypothetical protein